MALSVGLVGGGIAFAVKHLTWIEFSCGVCEGLVGIWDSVECAIVGLVVLDCRVKDATRSGWGFISNEVIWREREREREKEVYIHRMIYIHPNKYYWP